MFPKQEEPTESDTGLHSMAEFHRDIVSAMRPHICVLVHVSQEKKFGVFLDRNRVLESRLREMEQDRETEAEVRLSCHFVPQVNANLYGSGSCCFGAENQSRHEHSACSL